ncbi:MAG: uncharacterized protein JWR12_102 [Mucilaginibacter sp.]|nr:uncharacterized protein [Mucilaginibacter sp.]
MVEQHTQKDIEKIAYDILKSSKSWGIFPTPVDRIVGYSDLMFNSNMDVSQIHHGYLSRANDVLRSALSKIRGLFDRSENTIYLDLSLPDQKKNFVKLHEVAHGILPWQNQTTEFLDDDKTLDFSHGEEFEAEANMFASSTLFQLDYFEDEMDKLEFGIKSAMVLARKFGGSNHATIRRYVEKSNNRCSLLVLKDISPKGQVANCKFRDYFQSPKFTKQFGIINWPQEFGFNWPFLQDYYFKKKIRSAAEISLTTTSGVVEFHYDFFDTTYNAFVLIYPKGEKTGGKVKVILN